MDRQLLHHQRKARRGVCVTVCLRESWDLLSYLQQPQPLHNPSRHSKVGSRRRAPKSHSKQRRESQASLTHPGRDPMMQPLWVQLQSQDLCCNCFPLSWLKPKLWPIMCARVIAFWTVSWPENCRRTNTSRCLLEQRAWVQRCSEPGFQQCEICANWELFSK